MKKKVKSDKESTPVVDLKTLIHQHSLFFDNLVQLIPAKFYLPADENKPYFQGLNKTQKALAKIETKENVKKARRDRLDPEKSSAATTLDLLKLNIEKERKDDESDEDEEEDREEDEEEDEGDEKRAANVTYEELRQRLRQRIEACRGDRNVGCSKREQKRVERSERRASGPYMKRKRDAVESEERPRKSSEKDAEEASKELEFGKVKLDESGAKKKRKLSRKQELRKARESREAREGDDSVAQRHSWSAAENRAAGVKVHDDPKLLSRSIQKEKRKRQKSAEQWKKRVQETNKKMSDRQKKRTENIDKKKNEKKQRKIDKREKKLMRPGFEGRKTPA